MAGTDPGCVKTRESVTIGDGDPMGRLVEGVDRSQVTLLPECLDDWVGSCTSS